MIDELKNRIKSAKNEDELLEAVEDFARQLSDEELELVVGGYSDNSSEKCYSG